LSDNTLWNVRGVSEQARNMARKAAGMRDMFMGAWVEEAIKRQFEADMEAAGVRQKCEPATGIRIVAYKKP
jgi:hypothetical protein